MEMTEEEGGHECRLQKRREDMSGDGKRDEERGTERDLVHSIY